MKNNKIFITGTSGFVGFHLAKLLLEKGFVIHGFDGMTDYYDVRLKQERNNILYENSNFSMTEGMLEDTNLLSESFNEFKPNILIHLAAQAGVRYSLENPDAYINSNINGTFNILEILRKNKVDHFLFASTSSAYGGNTKMPFLESDKADSQLTLYAATKKANENMIHSYSHLFNIPSTVFRFFTVYGPWGRPDMALFKFTKGILEGTTIDVYNKGVMERDFTYISDLVEAVFRLLNVIPKLNKPKILGDSLSNVAPFRIVNIGNSQKIKLFDFIKIIENNIGKKAKCNLLGMQEGDVPSTWASNDLLRELTGFSPSVNVEDGVSNFVAWYRDYYKI
tara:strand:+ start:1521 stop:2531 length:1011 start_codon:yes stop_codon:yes gene_type:complete